ncbi:MAG: Ig-like domain-containing protein [Chloroflexota bacterium]
MKTRLIASHSWMVAFTVLVLASLACSLFAQPTPTLSPVSTEAEIPLPTDTPVPSPTPMLGLDVPLNDGGQPLAPQVVAQDPPPGAEVSVDGTISVTFDQPMDTDTTAAAWQVTDDAGNPVDGKVSWPTARTLQFNPARPLVSGEAYRARLSSAASSAAGVVLPDALLFTFQVVGDLQVTQVLPSEGTLDVAVDSAITVIFNRPVVPLVLAEDQSALPQPVVFEPPLAGKGEWLNTSVYVFHPEPAMSSATAYTARISAGLADATDETHLSKDYSWTFTTASPYISQFGLFNGISGQYYNPEAFYQNVMPNASYFIYFGQPMDRASVEANLQLLSATGENYPLVYDWQNPPSLPADSYVVFTPTVPLPLENTYTLWLGTSAQAASGGDLRDGLNWAFSTIPYPRVLWTNPGSGTTQNWFDNSFYVKFASPMNIESIKERVVFSPDVGGLEMYYNEWDWSVNFYGVLKPSTSYEVRFLPGMKDIFGNATTQEQVVRFTTAAVEPMATLLMPYNTSLYRVGGPQTFYAFYQNTNTIGFELYKLTPEAFFLVGYPYTPPANGLVWQTRKTIDAALNQRSYEPFTPTQPDGSPLEPGFYFLGMTASPQRSSERYEDSRTLVIANANLTFKTAPTEALLWLTDLNTGEPLAGVSLSVLDNNYQVVATGTTDADGKLYLDDLPPLEERYHSRYAISNDADVFAYAASQDGAGVNPWDFGIWDNYYAEPQPGLAYLYTDRPIYRPNQPVYFKGVVRIDDDLAYSLPSQAEVQVTVSNYNDEKIYEKALTLSPYGSFSDSFLLDENASLGYYAITARFNGQEYNLGTVGFTVAEYRKPEFQLDVTVDPLALLGGEMFDVNVQADYYSGGGLADADVSWYLSSETYTFEPPADYNRFSFSDYEWDRYWFGSEAGYGETVASGQGSTDGTGKFAISLPASLSDSGRSRRLTFEATVSDLSENYVSGRATVIAHQSRVYAGIRSASYIGRVGNEQAFEIAALDWDGKPVSGQLLDVAIVERRWHSVQKQDASGRVTWESDVEEIPVTSFTGVATDGQGLASVIFLPPNGGTFRARVTARDGQGNASTASAFLWVTGGTYIPWPASNDRSIRLVADRAEYTPGDTAEILIASPFQGQPYALVTVERGHIRQSQVVRLESNSQVYRLPITADMAPNVYVSVLIVKGVDATNSKPDFRMGMAELKVDTNRQALTVTLTPDNPQAKPGEAVTYQVRTTDVDGNPVSAEVSLSLSDLATLSLADPNARPILDYFYDRRALSVRTGVPLINSIEDYNAEIQEYAAAQGLAMGSGGGKGSDELGVTEVRRDFPDTAFWSAHLVTDADGQASATVTLPDNLTVWRMDARAVTEDTRVGQTTLDIVSTLPLLVRPQTPRFFVAGDEAILGTAVHNNTDGPLTVDVSLQAKGLTLIGEPIQQVDIPARRQAYVTWPVAVPLHATRVDVVFAAEGGGYRDASAPTIGKQDADGSYYLPVYRYEAPEVVGTAGLLAEPGTLVEAISLPIGFDVTEGMLTIRTSPSLAAGMTDSLAYLESYPYECVEQTISKFLPNILSLQAFQAAGLHDAALEAALNEHISTVLQRLYNWQNSDGGWGWWDAQISYPHTSAYVVLGLLEARQAGYTVDERVLARGLNYLISQLVSFDDLQGAEPYLLNRQAFLLYVLSRSDYARSASYGVQLYDLRDNLSVYARAFLAQTLESMAPGDPRVQTLLSDISSAAITSATGTHWEESYHDWYNWNTDTRTTAIVLAVLSQLDAQNPINANAVRWLMSNRTDGHWYGTQETAWTLMALSDWMVASGELAADYEYALGLNGERVGGGAANAETLRQTAELNIPVSDLLKDEINRLAFARSEGPGNLYYTAHLKVDVPVEQVLPLDRGMTLSRSYYRLDDPGTPVTQAQQGELLMAKLTVVVPHSLHYVVVDDPLPAGLEAVDRSLNTSQQSVDVSQYSYDELRTYGWGWWHFDHIQLRDERVVLSATYLPPGTYTYHYLVRAGTPGTFRVIPPTGQEFYFPEVYGRGAGSLFTVTPK